MLSETKADIIKTVGGSVSSEIERLLTLFTSSSESIESNFSSLRQRIDDLEHNVIEAIRQERD
jgi:lipid A disaccharide synthetase